MTRALVFALLFAGCAVEPTDDDAPAVASGDKAADAGPGTVDETDDDGGTGDDGPTSDGGSDVNEPDEPDEPDDPIDEPVADAGFAATGACTNASDTAVHDSMDVSDAVGTCAGDCFGGEECTTNCVVDATDLSPECSACYGEVTACTSSNCAFQCLGGESEGCEQCRDEAGCTAAFDDCAGF
jgi:hypothetical protein